VLNTKTGDWLERKTNPMVKVYRGLSDIAQRLHFAPLVEGPDGRLVHNNLVLMAFSYLLDKNHLLIGEPGWGKTTGAKIIAARYSGTPYDLYDAMEIRGNPQKYEEKIVGRYHYGALTKDGIEKTIWQGTFGLPVLIVDEGNRLPSDSQDVILQGIDTGRWNYQNSTLYQGKKPTFITVNERPGHHQNGFIDALKDRFDIVTEDKFWTTMNIFDLSEAKRLVVQELHRPEFTDKALEALSRDFSKYQEAIKGKPIEGHLTPEEKAQIQEAALNMELSNDAMFFLQAFMAEINYSAQYGCKRSSDPPSTHSHDENYAGVAVRHSFSPRSAMAIEYAQMYALFLGEEETTLDHMKFVLPYLYAHKAEFSDDYRNKKGNDPRTDCEMIHLAKTLVGEVHERYTDSIQKMKNFIMRLKEKDLTPEEIESQQVNMGDGQIMSLKEEDHDHPLMKDFIREALDGERKAFYEEIE
jgi:MoxR-like ATPase